MNAPATHFTSPARRLIAGLGPLSERLSGADGGHLAGPFFSRHCVHERERLARVQTPCPILCVVMRGTKEVWIGEREEVAPAGSVLVFPPDTPMDLVNIPDERTGRYEAIVVEVRDVPPPPVRLGGPTAAGLRVTLTEELADALIHTARTALSETHCEALCLHRLHEVLMLLAGDPAAAPLFDRSLGQRVAQTIAADPARDWTVDAVAAELGMGASTLRRRLAGEGRPFRQVLTQTRMNCARQLLKDGRASVTEAAGLAGYASRSHFARRYRAAFGHLPREARAG